MQHCLHLPPRGHFWRAHSLVRGEDSGILVRDKRTPLHVGPFRNTVLKYLEASTIGRL